MTEYILYTQTMENNMNLPKSRCIFAQLYVKTETENMRNKILLNVVASILVQIIQITLTVSGTPE